MNLRGSTEARQRLECGELAPAFRRAKAPASRTHSKRFAHDLGLRWRRRFMEREHLQNIDVSWGLNLRGSTEARQRLECGELAPAFRRAKAPASRTHSKRFAQSFALGEHH